MTQRIYYHGTRWQNAIAALSSGEPLLPMRPKGRARFAKSVEGFTYVTPSFRQAVEYALMTDRADWPDEHDLRAAEQPHVFAFDLADVANLRLEEDELGWAARVALEVVHGGRGMLVNGRKVARPGGAWSFNLDFADSFANDPDAIEAMVAELAHIYGAAAFGKLASSIGYWDGRKSTAVGHRLATALSPEFQACLRGKGISLAVGEPVQAVGGWKFEIGKFPGAPDEADAVDGAWSIGSMRP